jgi:hypothetical protein
MISPVGRVSCCYRIVFAKMDEWKGQRTFDSWASDIAAQNGDGSANASWAWRTFVQAILAFNEACVQECQAWGYWFRIVR